MSTPRLRLSGVSKSYGPVHALTDMSFDVEPAEIRALVGENGAGKSTIVGVITGLTGPTSGRIELDGEPIRYRTPREARLHGVTAVYQDPRLFNDLSVAENIYTGMYPRTATGALDWTAMREGATQHLAAVGVSLDPRALVGSLSLAEAQFVEIARALAVNSKLLILDEPTAALTPAETETLFRVVRELRDRGTSVIWISHRIEEIRALADSVTVIRDGSHVLTRPAADLTDEQIVAAMVGREISVIFERDQSYVQDSVVLSVQNLGVEGQFADVSFDVRAGEVVGLGGIVGAGRTEIVEAICGIRTPDTGSVELNGRRVRLRGTKDMLRYGIAYVPENRDAAGLLTALRIDRNISLPSLPRISRATFVRDKEEASLAQSQISALSIKIGSIADTVASLSGGNRQKVALARWLATDPRLLLLDEPTHGIDVGTKVEVHRIIQRLAERGLAIVVISSDLSELLSLSDTIQVIAAGRLSATMAAADATRESVMTAATSSAASGGVDHGR